MRLIDADHLTMLVNKAIKHFENVRDGAIAVLDSGFGKHEGESSILYQNRKTYAELAIEALKKTNSRISDNHC